MIKSKFFKIVVSTFLVLMALWVATPKVYIHDLLHHDHSSISFDAETKLQSSQSADDCDYDEYNKPVYFNIFKFVNNFIPLKPQSSISTEISAFKFSTISYAISLLRAPPISQ